MPDWWEVLKVVVGAMGWLLAAWQYWRHERSRQPLVLLEIKGRTKDGIRLGWLIVRNRAPRDLYVHEARMIAPAGAMFVYGDGRSPTLAIGWRIKAFASGEFPSASGALSFDLPPRATAVMLAIVISDSLDASLSRRVIVRQSIQMQNSSANI